MKRIVGVSLLLVSLVCFVVLRFPDSKLKIVACGVGQGDAFLIHQSFFQVIVDSGPEGTLLPCLGKFLPFWDSKIEVLILTHPQADHISGAVDLFDRYQIETLVVNGVGSDSKLFEELHKKVVESKETRVLVPKKGDEIVLGELSMKMLWPLKPMGEAKWWKEEKAIIELQNISKETGIDDLNQISIVMLLEYGGFKALFTGDIGEEEEKALVESGLLEPVSLLKMAHHGSKFSNSSSFIRKVSPLW